ncbi:putative oligopeptide transporter (OPT) family protein [Geomicrobium halophilum]|uniref:Putative oligopeptide transporter (OPT) family protein n=1 Tax=Geomicrobium halophilum TaxID=549000 RepID=A0A841PVY4_9BACL|nr:hypothetical protein [Geomicrobium halophilum]MBB6450541.1 putative oligopeptide transporter (OPT) family protein [Geomicrobium halophilum]
MRSLKAIITTGAIIAVSQFVLTVIYQGLFAEQIHWPFVIVSTLIMAILVITTAIARKRMVKETEEKP